MPRRQSGGFLHKELAKLDNNYFAKERFAALASRHRLGNHRAAGIMAAAIGAQFQDAGGAAAMQLALAAVLIRNATVNFIPAHRLIRFGTRDINYELINFSCLRMGSYAELVRIHAALDIDDGWESCRHDIVPGAKRPRVTHDVTSLTAFTAWLYRMSQSGSLNATARGLNLVWHPTQVSCIVAAMTDVIYERWHTKVELDSGLFGDQIHLNACAAAIRHAGMGMVGQHVIGFVDGTHLPIARPSGADDRQRVFYDGHHGV